MVLYDGPDVPPPALIVSVRRSTRRQQCGCFYCKKIYGPDRIVDWADPQKPHEQQTAVCPECGIDSVIGNASGFEITEAFLEDMRTAWFSEIAPSSCP